MGCCVYGRGFGLEPERVRGCAGAGVDIVDTHIDTGSGYEEVVDVHESMGKSDFRAVDYAVAHGLYEDEIVVVYGIEEEALD